MRETNLFTRTDSLSLLILASINGVGYWTLRKLAERRHLFDYFCVETAAEFLALVRSAGGKPVLPNDVTWEDWRHVKFKEANKFLNRLQHSGISIIHHFEEEFPHRLNEIDEPPYWLFVEGHISVLHKRAVAIVGTRKPTEDGRYLALNLFAHLSQLKLVTVSGLALGIDQLAHESSLDVGVPTIAVLGTGILTDYPAGSGVIRKQIVKQGGAIITEYLPHESYGAANFARRNRIQAGLAEFVIPVEWRIDGGTAHTVRFALNAKRRLLCLRREDWTKEDHPEIEFAKKHGARVFTLPRHMKSLIRTLMSKTRNKTRPGVVRHGRAQRNNLFDN